MNPVFRVLKYITNSQNLYHAVPPWVQILFLLIYYSKTLPGFTCSKTINGSMVVSLEMRIVVLGAGHQKKCRVCPGDEDDTDESIGLRPRNESPDPQH